jgi:hypothetical protein
MMMRILENMQNQLSGILLLLGWRSGLSLKERVETINRLLVRARQSAGFVRWPSGYLK